MKPDPPIRLNDEERLASADHETDPGAVPEGWRAVQLADILEHITNGLTQSQNRDGNGLPITRIETISSDRIDPSRMGYVQGLSPLEVARYRLQPGDILFSHINSEPQIGRSVVYEGLPPLLLHGMNLLRMRPRSEVCDFRFLNYSFMLMRRLGVFVALASRAVGQSSVNQGKLKSVIVHLPPLTEQKAICEVLRTAQRAKETTEAVIAATRELKKSLMRHLFTYGPVPVQEAEQVQLKETEIGLVPEHWRVVPLRDVAHLFSGGTPSKARSEWWEGPVPWASPKDLKQPRLRDTEDHISEEGVYNGSRLVPAGSIFMVVRGMILAKQIPVALTDVPMAFNQDMKAIVPLAVVDSVFLLYALEWNKRGLLMQIGTSAHGTRRLSSSSVEELAVGLPPLDEQVRIAEAMTAVDRKIDAGESRKQALEALFDSLLHNLMTGKVRVGDLEHENAK